MRIEDLIGKELGRYTVTRLLGRGGMAAVFEAQDSVLRRPVALKILYGQFLADAGLVERFRREAIIAASLEHPNIIPIYDVGETDGIVYIAMKLLSGRSLQDELLANNALEPERVIDIIRQVAAALDYAHGKGVIHRDIKPGNVMLLPDGRVVLSDFGIAKSLDAPGMTGTGVIVGTPDYMAPEQIDAKHGPLDGRSDIYALAVMAYRMLTGGRPFDGSTTDVLLAHLTRLPQRASERNPELPPSLDRVLAQAMAKKPEDRTATAGDFARDLAEAVGEATAIGELTPPPARRRPGEKPDPQGARPAVIPTAAAEQIVSQAESQQPKNAPQRQPQAARSRPATWPILVLLGLLVGGVLTGAAMTIAKSRSNINATATAAARQASAGGAATSKPTPTRRPRPTVSPTSGPSATIPATPTNPPDTAAPTPTSESPAPTATAPPPTSAPAPQPTTPPVVVQPTRVPPTRVPPPTAVPPTPLPPTPTPGCAQEPISGFGAIWHSDVAISNAIGCPTGPEAGVQSSLQYFDGGMMFWTKQPNVIYVFYNYGGWEVYDNFADPSYDNPRLSDVPTDKFEPVRGFGKIWFEYPLVKEALGWGSTPEVGFTGAHQFFENGRMLYAPSVLGIESRIWVLFGNNTYRRFRTP